MDFYGRVCKLLMFCTGAGSNGDDAAAGVDDGVGGDKISAGTFDLLRFLSFLTPYYNPSNTGGWTLSLGALLHYLSYELCARVGSMAGWKVLQRDHPEVAQRLLVEEPYLKNVNLSGKEIVSLLDKMLPLAQQVRERQSYVLILFSHEKSSCYNRLISV